jgi:hypothetical protein
MFCSLPLWIVWQESFREEVASRGGEFKETIFSFGPDEEEDYALWCVKIARMVNPLDSR